MTAPGRRPAVPAREGPRGAGPLTPSDAPTLSRTRIRLTGPVSPTQEAAVGLTRRVSLLFSARSTRRMTPGVCGVGVKPAACSTAAA